jgi:hypothetical protein
MKLVIAFVSAAVVLQTAEMFFVRPWKWQIIRGEMPKLLRPFLKLHEALITVRFIAIILLIHLESNPAALSLGVEYVSWTAVLLTTWLLAIRWRGTFNGGSDALTFQALIAIVLFKFNPAWEPALTVYLTFILVASYFIAGLVKLKEPGWRDGSTLNAICAEYGLKARPGIAGAWALMLFELLFPLAVFVPWVFLPLAAGFHLAAAYTLGLNRFFLTWLAVYPILFSFKAMFLG